MELLLKLSTDRDLVVHQEDPAVEEGGQEDLVVDLELVEVADLVLVGEVDLVLVEEEVVVWGEAVEEVLLVALLVQVMLEELVVLVVQDLWRKQSLVYQETIIQSLVMYQRPPSFVMVKLMEVIMLTQRQSVKHSISVPMMEMGV